MNRRAPRRRTRCEDTDGVGSVNFEVTRRAFTSAWVGRGTPCAPLGVFPERLGAHGVTRPTLRGRDERLRCRGARSRVHRVSVLRAGECARAGIGPAQPALHDGLRSLLPALRGPRGVRGRRSAEHRGERGLTGEVMGMGSGGWGVAFGPAESSCRRRLAATTLAQQSKLWTKTSSSGFTSC